MTPDWETDRGWPSLESENSLWVTHPCEFVSRKGGSSLVIQRTSSSADGMDVSLQTNLAAGRAQVFEWHNDCGFVNQLSDEDSCPACPERSRRERPTERGTSPVSSSGITGHGSRRASHHSLRTILYSLFPNRK